MTDASRNDLLVPRLALVLALALVAACKPDVPSTEAFEKAADALAEAQDAGADAAATDAGTGDTGATAADSTTGSDAAQPDAGASDSGPGPIDAGPADSGPVDAGCTTAKQCDDGDECTVGDNCKDGVCVKGAAKDCDDNNPCTKDLCEPAKGCVTLPVTATCTDNNACTTLDRCKGGACTGSKAPDCDDNEPCTDDSCDVAKGCVNAPSAASCTDNDKCTAGDVCKSGKCAPGKAVTCDDKNVCTKDSCDKLLGCVFGKPNKCKDGNGCTDDSCHKTKGCQHVNNKSSCSDGNPCTDKDRCKDGKCTAGGPKDCYDGDPCTPDPLCDPKTGCGTASKPVTCGSKKDPCLFERKCGSGCQYAQRLVPRNLRSSKLDYYSPVVAARADGGYLIGAVSKAGGTKRSILVVQRVDAGGGVGKRALSGHANDKVERRPVAIKQLQDGRTAMLYEDGAQAGTVNGGGRLGVMVTDKSGGKAWRSYLHPTSVDVTKTPSFGASQGLVELGTGHVALLGRQQVSTTRQVCVIARVNTTVKALGGTAAGNVSMFTKVFTGGIFHAEQQCAFVDAAVAKDHDGSQRIAALATLELPYGVRQAALARLDLGTGEIRDRIVLKSQQPRRAIGMVPSGDGLLVFTERVDNMVGIRAEMITAGGRRGWIRDIPVSIKPGQQGQTVLKRTGQLTLSSPAWTGKVAALGADLDEPMMVQLQGVKFADVDSIPGGGFVFVNMSQGAVNRVEVRARDLWGSPTCSAVCSTKKIGGCDDGKACTIDGCDPLLKDGCKHDKAAANGRGCIPSVACKTGVCQSGSCDVLADKWAPKQLPHTHTDPIRGIEVAADGTIFSAGTRTVQGKPTATVYTHRDGKLIRTDSYQPREYSTARAIDTIPGGGYIACGEFTGDSNVATTTKWFRMILIRRGTSIRYMQFTATAPKAAPDIANTRCTDVLVEDPMRVLFAGWGGNNAAHGNIFRWRFGATEPGIAYVEHAVNLGFGGPWGSMGPDHFPTAMAKDRTGKLAVTGFNPKKPTSIWVRIFAVNGKPIGAVKNHMAVAANQVAIPTAIIGLPGGNWAIAANRNHRAALMTVSAAGNLIAGHTIISAAPHVGSGVVPAAGGGFYTASIVANSLRVIRWNDKVVPLWMRGVSGSVKTLKTALSAGLRALPGGDIVLAGHAIKDATNNVGFLHRVGAWGQSTCEASDKCAVLEQSKCSDGKDCTTDECTPAKGCEHKVPSPNNLALPKCAP